MFTTKIWPNQGKMCTRQDHDDTGRLVGLSNQFRELTKPADSLNCCLLLLNCDIHSNDAQCNSQFITYENVIVKQQSSPKQDCWTFICCCYSAWRIVYLPSWSWVTNSRESVPSDWRTVTALSVIIVIFALSQQLSSIYQQHIYQHQFHILQNDTYNW